MAQKERRALSDLFRELVEALKEALSPRQLAPVPIPAREQQRRR